VFGIEFLRLEETQALSGHLQNLQKIQNNALRIITGQKLKDHVRISDMLDSTNTLSVNQTIAYSSIMEMWKAREFEIPELKLVLGKIQRSDDRTLRSDSSEKLQSCINEPFGNKVVQLWNSASERFKTTNLLVIAKREARKLVHTLPI